MKIPEGLQVSVSHHADIIAATRKWLERAVIGLNLCPVARVVHVKGQVRYAVSAAQTADALLDDLLREIKFLDLVKVVLRKQGLAGVLQVASFHPDYVFADAEPDDIANHTNRAPWPTLHLIREASLARATAALPDATDIYQRNIETLRTLGLEGWQALGVYAPAKRKQ